MKMRYLPLLLIGLLATACSGETSSDVSQNPSNPINPSLPTPPPSSGGGNSTFPSIPPTDSVSNNGDSASYYATIDFNQRGANLKTALSEKIYDHTQRSYDSLWTDFRSTDMRSDGKVWDMYSNESFTFGSKQCGNYKVEGDCYNREHSFPKSWFSEGKPMYTDLMHLVPTDGYVNGRRSNFAFGEVGVATYTSKNGSKLGRPQSYLGYSDTVFEPVNSYKGDFARIYFYMATAYQSRVSSWNSPHFDKNSYPTINNWTLTMLKRWSKNDPVSQKEIDRNNAVFNIQKNRNPYVDYPGLEDLVWNA